MGSSSMVHVSRQPQRLPKRPWDPLQPPLGAWLGVGDTFGNWKGVWGLNSLTSTAGVRPCS